MTTVNAFKPLTKEDLADVLGVSIRTIENWVNADSLPPPRRLGNRVYWHPDIFYAWLDRILLAEPASAESAPDNVTKAQPARVEPKARRHSATVKTEQDKVSNRTQAQMDALMAPSHGGVAHMTPSAI